MTDYNTMTADIQFLMDNSEPKFVAAIPSFIARAEDRWYRDYEGQPTETIVTGSLDTSGYLTVPDDYIAPRNLSIFVGGKRVVVRLKTCEFLFERYPDTTLSGQPKYYAIYQAQELQIGPKPDSTYPYELGYRRRLPRLSTINLTNWVTENAYDSLLAAAMSNAARAVIDDRAAGMVQQNEGVYDSAMKALVKAAGRAERDDYRVPFVPVQQVTENRQ